MLESASVPVLVTTTRHRAVVELSVALEAQSAAFVGSQDARLDSTQICSCAEMPDPGGGLSAATWAVAVEPAEVMTGPVGGCPLAVTVWVNVDGGVTLSVSHS